MCPADRDLAGCCLWERRPAPPDLDGADHDLAEPHSTPAHSHATIVLASPTVTPAPPSAESATTIPTPTEPSPANEIQVLAPQVLAGHSGAVRSLDFSPDATLLASASSDRTAKIWDVATGRLLHRLDADQHTRMYVVFSLDGQMLASGGDDGQVRLWDVGSGKLVHTLHGHSGEIYTVAFSPVDGLLASAGEGGDVLLWRITPAAASSPATSGGSLIAFVSTRDGNGEIYVMDVTHALPGSEGSDVRRLTNWRLWDGYPSWSPDGDRIAFLSGCDGNDEMCVTDLHGDNAQRLTGHATADWFPFRLLRIDGAGEELCSQVWATDEADGGTCCCPPLTAATSSPGSRPRRAIRPRLTFCLSRWMLMETRSGTGPWAIHRQ